VAYRVNPYFNRTVEHFCSHIHTPANPADTEPGIVMNKTGAYAAWNLFEDYGETGSLPVRNSLFYLLDQMLDGHKTVSTNLPAQGIVTVTRQKDRVMVHLLYASPVRRGKNTEIIEDVLPVSNTKVSFRAGEKIDRVYLVPQKTQIPFTQSGGTVSFTVEAFENHQMIVMEQERDAYDR